VLHGKGTQLHGRGTQVVLHGKGTQLHGKGTQGVLHGKGTQLHGKGTQGVSLNPTAIVQVLSDFIVKHRGVFTVNTKDAFENIDQVEDIVFSSYDACTLPDPADTSQRPFVAEVNATSCRY